MRQKKLPIGLERNLSSSYEAKLSADQMQIMLMLDYGLIAEGRCCFEACRAAGLMGQKAYRVIYVLK